jgi:chorismate mutase/prephenate dehydratase
MSDVTTRDEIREAISTLDQKLVDTIAQRADLVEQILDEKARAGLPVRDRKREQAVLETALARGELKGVSRELIEPLFQSLFEASIQRQRTRFDSLRDEDLNEASVAYLGGPGSYSHIAAQKILARRRASVVPAPKRDFISIFRSVESGEVDFGVLPIENTTTGSITEVCDLLLAGHVQIVGEYFLRVDHCLIGRSGALGRVSRVLGHPQVLAQCRRYLAGHPEIESHMVSSSTRALERLLEEDDNVAVLAGADGAALFGFDILARDVGDHEQNYTRFIIVARKAKQPTKAVECKTSMMFTTRDTPGALIDALTGFRDNQINLVKLESRPIAGNPWEEMFLMDVDGHIEDEPLVNSMETLQQHTREIKLLGCYAADRIDKVKI